MNAPTGAVRDALGTTIDNGPTLPRPKAPRAWRGRTIATPVVVTLAPLWRCDSTTCPKPSREGMGGQPMLEHAATFHGRTGVFTDRRQA